MKVYRLPSILSGLLWAVAVVTAAGYAADGGAAKDGVDPAGGKPLVAGVGGVTQPSRIESSYVKPEYPEKARLSRLEGRVILQAVVGADGTVGEVAVLQSSKPGLGFEEAATEAVRRWRYEPALREGEPVAVYFTVVVEFSLNEDVSDLVHVDEELNYRFEHPLAPWVEIDASSVNADAALGYVRMAPAMTFLIVAENVGVGAGDFPTEGLAEIVTARLKSVATDVEVVSREPRTVNGLDGLFLVTDVGIGSQELTYAQWVYSGNGFLYQLATTASRRVTTREQLLEQADQLLERFELIDPGRIAQSASKALDTFRSSDFGYRFDFTGKGWSSWPDLRVELPAAEVGGLLGADTGFVIVPVSIGPTEVSLDGLTEALVAELDFEFPGSEIESATPLEGSPIPGYAISARRRIDELSYVYRMRVLRTDEHGYLLAAWRLAETFGDGTALDELLDLVVIDASHPAGTGALTGEVAASQGRILSNVAAHHLGRSDPVTGVALFERAFLASPSEPGVVGGWISSANQASGPAHALRLFREHGGGLKDDLGFLSWEPYLEAEIGNFEAAVTAYDGLFARGYRATEDFLQYARSLRQLDRLDRAIEFLAARYAGPPFDQQLALALGDAYQEADELAEALRVCDELLERGYKTAEVYFLRATTEYALGSYREAKQSFEEAARRNPADQQVRQFLDHVSGLLGEGANSALKNVIEPVPIPEELTQAAERAEIPSAADDFGAYFLHRVTAIAFTAGEEYRTTDSVVARILNRRGATRLKTLVTGYDPFLEEIHVNALRVRDEAGEIVAEGNPADYYVVDNAEQGMASQQRNVHMPIAGLEPGRLLELTVTRRRLGRSEELPWFQHVFAYSLPTARSSVVLVGSIDRVAHVERNGVKYASRKKRMTWTVEQPPIPRQEPFAEFPAAYLPIVSMGDAAATWKALGASYLKDIAEALEPDTSIDSLAERLMAGLDDPTERIRTLVTHVQNDLDYTAVEFGRRAWIPNLPGKIVRAGQGDCKDHALLLYHLLRAREIPAKLALVNVAGPIESAVPSLDQFDHMIVYVPGLGNGGFIDTTDKSHDLIALPPVALAERRALVLDENGSSLVQIPAYPVDSNVFESRRLLRVGVDGDLTIDETVTMNGYASMYLRPALRNADSQTQQILVQNFLSGWINNLQVHELTTQNLAQPLLPLVLQVRYSVKGSFTRDGVHLEGRIPGGWERSFLIAPHLEERKSPVRIQYPARFRSTVTIEPPPGYAPAPARAARVKDSDPFFSWAVDSDVREGRVELRFELSRHAGSHASTAYSRLQQSVDDLVRLIEPKLDFDGPERSTDSAPTP